MTDNFQRRASSIGWVFYDRDRKILRIPHPADNARSIYVTDIEEHQIHQAVATARQGQRQVHKLKWAGD